MKYRMKENISQKQHLGDLHFTTQMVELSGVSNEVNMKADDTNKINTLKSRKSGHPVNCIPLTLSCHRLTASNTWWPIRYLKHRNKDETIAISGYCLSSPHRFSISLAPNAPGNLLNCKEYSDRTVSVSWNKVLGYT